MPLFSPAGFVFKKIKADLHIYYREHISEPLTSASHRDGLYCERVSGSVRSDRAATLGNLAMRTFLFRFNTHIVQQAMKGTQEMFFSFPPCIYVLF